METKDTESKEELEGWRNRFACIELASRFLVEKGYEIVAREWKCRDGIADIVAHDHENGVIVFASVFEELTDEYMTSAYRNKMEHIAASFVFRYEAESVDIRFDAICFKFNEDFDRALIRHHIDVLGGESSFKAGM